MVNEAINGNRMASEWMFNFLVKKANENGRYTVIIVDNKKYNFIFFLSQTNYYAWIGQKKIRCK